MIQQAVGLAIRQIFDRAASVSRCRMRDRMERENARQKGKAEREKCVNFRIQREEKVTLIVGSIGMISIAVRSLTWELIQFYRRTRVIIIIDFGFDDTLKSAARAAICDACETCFDYTCDLIALKHNVRNIFHRLCIHATYRIFIVCIVPRHDVVVL